jgi:hypothetical protein
MGRWGQVRGVAVAALIGAALAGCTSSALFSPPEGIPPRPATAGTYPTLAAEQPPRDRPLMTAAEIAAREQAMRAAGEHARREAGAITGVTRN